MRHLARGECGDDLTRTATLPAIVAEPMNHAPIVRPVFTGRSRWAAAVVLVTGTLLQVIEFLLGDAPDDNAARVAFWAEHPSRIDLSMVSGMLAVPFLIGGFAVLVALTRARSPRLAWTAGTFLTFAMVGLAVVHGYELAAYGLTRSGDLAAATAALNGDHLGLPGVVFFVMFLGGAILGTLALAAAVWRSPLVPRIVAVCILAFAVLDFALGQGVVGHLVNLAGFAIAAVAVVAGYSRQPRADAQQVLP
ncbi:MAG TPA: hypothetical protein VNL77_02360 [Roseiflexaceae bacterium]|nr:hypothetical protein [Roseiflexaceae bacterium]